MAWLETVKEYAFAFKDWFLGLPMENQIIYGLILFLLTAAAVVTAYYIVKYVILGVYYLVYGVAWLVGNAVYGVLWLTAEILKATFMGVIIALYSLFAVFVMLPLKLILNQNYTLDAFGQELEYNIEDFVYRVYPDEKKKKATQNLVTTPSAPVIAAEIKTEVQQPAPAKSVNTPTVFHCSNCGAAFTPRMQTLLTERHQCHCEGCGQKFIQNNNLPAPSEIKS